MSRTGLVFLIAALVAAVFGFGADAPPAWTWEKGSSLLFLVLAAASFVGSTLREPSLFWEVLKEFRGSHSRTLILNPIHERKCDDRNNARRS
ncbi:DUF1328 domain-containing protein [Planctellipticum variicoloris]|jgi:hypothetical protein|uniref:DUF1328 domain-containing protein n=1 Tax=Planctellipticum variicoloris TaxID=3064265 RepID=UPI002B7C51BF|nr:DUF1328 domain-containing protein [Planctomycetaceae bacterium SH412]WLD15164.1 DUF1328 domain-containing protein [Planctomycetaceae bacterium SH412]HTN03151.1 DUF1328 domain-containing protein [Planctomycetaceae bacterium]